MSNSNQRALSKRTAPDSPLRLEELGLGLDSALMNEPKIFRERSFLGLLLAELEDKLGPEKSRHALFEIGARHGMRDARSTCQAAPACDADRKKGPGGAFSPSLPMLLFDQNQSDGSFEIRGHWPDGHEAGARLDRLGHSEHPSCFLSTGYTSGWLSETRGQDFVVTEEHCSAAHGDGCRFRAVQTHAPKLREEPTRIEQGSAKLQSTNAPSIDQREAIHIWGPVMVLPCGRPADALTTLHKLLEDASLREVQVVVLDLLNASFAQGRESDAFNDLLASIEQWGAETVVTGLSPQTRAVLLPQERPMLIGPNELPQAIAMAFQVVEAGRHLI